MRLFLLASALAMAAFGARAETTACTTIGSLPYVITTPGRYCLASNLAHTAVVGNETGILVRSTHDVELDCNDFTLTGTRTTPANRAANDQYTGIKVGSSTRVAVRHCRISGFNYGIQVQSAGNGMPRSSDVVLEQNTIDGSWTGVLAIPEGDSRIAGNVIMNALGYGLWINAPPGQLRVRNNSVLSTGDTAHWVGQAANLRNDLGGWLIFEGNLITETASPSATPAGSPVVDIPAGGGIGIAFVGNQVSAPAVAGRKGGVTSAINNATANGCNQNLFIGYGELPTHCTDPSNQALRAPATGMTRGDTTQAPIGAAAPVPPAPLVGQAAFAPPPRAGAGTQCTGYVNSWPKVIATPGVYCMVGNLSGALAVNQAAVTINASNVVLDCNGYSLTETGSVADDRGVSFGSRRDIEVRNCHFANFGHGIYGGGANERVVVRDNTVSNSRGIAVQLSLGNGSVVDNRVVDTSNGGPAILVLVADGAFATVSGNLVRNVTGPGPTMDGIRVFGTGRAKVEGNVISGIGTGTTAVASGIRVGTAVASELVSIDSNHFYNPTARNSYPVFKPLASAKSRCTNNIATGGTWQASRGCQ